MTGDLQMDNELELVRRGFDPAQVQQLVGQLSTELKSMASENERLRARVSELEHAPEASGASTAPDDVFSHWGKETNDLLAAARSSIATVTEKATADAAAAIAAGETAGASIRQRAQLDAEGVVSEARHQAAGIVADAETAKAAIEADAQATLDLTNEELAKLEAKLEELRGHRSAMSTQLATAKSHLLNLMAMVDEPEGQSQADAAAPERDSTEATATDEQS
jgi:cell division septum initiation protein DivIVA